MAACCLLFRSGAKLRERRERGDALAAEITTEFAWVNKQADVMKWLKDRPGDLTRAHPGSTRAHHVRHGTPVLWFVIAPHAQ